MRRALGGVRGGRGRWEDALGGFPFVEFEVLGGPGAKQTFPREP